jgi:HSP20 family protein
MPIAKTNRGVSRFQPDLFDRFFGDFRWPTFSDEGDRWFSPSVDVSESDDAITVKAEMPGMKKEDIDIAISEGLLTLSGEKKDEQEEKKENYHVRESRYGSFRRTVRLPAGVEADQIDANYKDGILTVSVPKSEKAKSKKIEVKG